MGSAASRAMKVTAHNNPSSKIVPETDVVNDTTQKNEDDLKFGSHHNDEEYELSEYEEEDDNDDENTEKSLHNATNVLKSFFEKNKNNSDECTVFSKVELFQVINEAIRKLENTPKLPNIENLENGLCNNLRAISEAFFAFQKINPLPDAVARSYQREAGRLLTKKKIIRKMCNLINEGLGVKNEEGNIDYQHTYVIKKALNILWNFSDCTKEVTRIITSDSEFLETLKKVLEVNSPERKEAKEMNEFELYLVQSILGIMHNIGMVEDNIPRIKSLKIVGILCSYLQSESASNYLNALSILANIMDKEESKTLQKNPAAMNLLHEILKEALKHTSHECSLGGVIWRAKDCAFIVRRLAKNDEYSKLLVEIGFLPHLVKMLQEGAPDDQKEAVGAIWSLSFDEKNQKKILEYDNPDVVKMIFRLRRTSDDKDVRKTADGCLWTLLDQLQQDKKYKEKYKHIVSFYPQKNAETQEKKGHIMISYNRTHRQELIRIRNELKSKGFRVWMDIYEMKGSTLEAMHKAVHAAHIVLMCMSQGYQYSDNCRLEAINAWKKKKTIIPLLMQREYEADQWVDMILQDKTYYDFSGKYPFEQKFEELLGVIKDLYGQSSTEDVPASSITPVREWTEPHVTNWINQHRLPRKLFGHLTGRDLSALVTMKEKDENHAEGYDPKKLKEAWFYINRFLLPMEAKTLINSMVGQNQVLKWDPLEKAPDCFYNWLQKKLKLNSLSTIDMFMEALSDIKE